MISMRVNWVVQSIRFRGDSWRAWSDDIPAVHLPASTGTPFTILLHEVEMDCASKTIVSENVAFHERPFDAELGCVRLAIPPTPVVD